MYENETLHEAARKGNLRNITRILYNLQDSNVINNINEHGETPLLCAIFSGKLSCVKKIIEHGASLELLETLLEQIPSKPQHYMLQFPIEYNCIKDLPIEGKNNSLLLHAGAENDNTDILEYLLSNSSLEQLLEYRCEPLMNSTPFEYAAYCNKYKAFKYLLEKSVERATSLNKIFDHTAIFLNAIRRNNMYICNEIVKCVPNAVQILEKNGHQPLYESILFSKDNVIITFLIKNGADLSLVYSKSKQTAIYMLIKYRPKPSQYLADIFDSCIENTPVNGIIDITTVDYSVLTPNTDSEDNDQMRLLKALINTGNKKGQKELLAHPLVESFLYLKWESFSRIYSFIFILYLIYATSVSFTIVGTMNYTNSSFVLSINDTNSRTTSRDHLSIISLVCLYVSLGIIVTLDLVQIITYKITIMNYITLTPRRWIYVIKTVCKFGSYILVAIAPVNITKDSVNEQLKTNLATLTLVISWTHVLILLSKSRKMGYYLQMFWNVALKITQILAVFSVLIIMFSLCFTIQFHAKEPFARPLVAITKTLVMMTSEFEYLTYFANATEISTSSYIIHFLFVVYLVLGSLTLMNLTIGVAVNDIQSLVHKSKLQKLEKQVEFLSTLEQFRRNDLFYYVFKWSNYKNVPQKLNMYNNVYEYVFGAELGLELQKKVYEQMKKEDVKKESENYLSKLDDILRAVKEMKKN